LPRPGRDSRHPLRAHDRCGLRVATGVHRLRRPRSRQAIRGGTLTGVKDLITAIETYIDGQIDRCQPFTLTKTADEILPKATGGQRTSFTRH
jgi:hypothetical protein